MMLFALIGTALLGSAWAGSEVDEEVARARALILAEDYEGAAASLDRAEAAAPEADEVVLGSTLARIWYLRGAIEYHVGDRNEAMLQHWRQALVLDLNARFDRETVHNPESSDLFEALRSEVGQRQQFASGAREDAVDARIFVDGQLMQPFDHLRRGTHLAQVMCPDGQLHSAWVDVTADPDFYSLCPTAVVFTDGPAPGEEELVEEVVEDEGRGREPKPPKEPRPPREPREPPDLDIPSIALMSGGGLVLGAGVASNFLLVEPAWDELESARTQPATVTRDQADGLTRDFNVRRFTTLGAIGLGALSLGAGIAVNDTVGFIASPNGVVVVGRF
jgi:hypothetical protein